jgi:hypothetical protein
MAREWRVDWNRRTAKPQEALLMRTELTGQVVEKYFSSLENGDLESALALLAPDVEFDLPQDDWNRVIPISGSTTGSTR